MCSGDEIRGSLVGGTSYSQSTNYSKTTTEVLLSVYHLSPLSTFVHSVSCMKFFSVFNSLRPQIFFFISDWVSSKKGFGAH